MFLEMETISMKTKTHNLVSASLLLAFGLLLPYFFHMTGMAGPIFLPMHIPVLLGGLLLGPRYGLILGIITPLLNSLLTGMPPIYPTGVSMTFELATYGFITGYLYRNRNYNIYLALIPAMLLGRLVSGIATYLLLSFGGKLFVLKMFLGSAFVKSIWGILIQIAFVPMIVKVLEKSREIKVKG